MGSRMLSEGGLLIKEKLDLAFDDEMEDLKGYIGHNEKISFFEFLWGFCLHLIDEVLCCGKYRERTGTRSRIDSSMLV